MSESNQGKAGSNPAVILYPVDQVKVDREVRQRTKVDEGVDELAEDIETNGLLHPISIHEDGRLVAGERRWEAHRRKGWPVIRAQVLERLDPVQAYRIELTENIRRQKLPWQDEVRAVGIYHQMRQQTVGAMWTVKGTAEDLKFSETKAGRYLIVFEQLGDPEVMGCQTFEGALNLLKGRADRLRAAAASRGLDVASAMPTISAAATPEAKGKALSALISKKGIDSEPKPEGDGAADIALIEAGRVAEASLKQAARREAAAATSPVVTANFIEWAPAYEGPQFDLLHVDFPYGKNYEGSNTRKTGRAHIAPTYVDSEDVMWELVETLITWQDKLAYPIAHLLFWFDMEFYDGVKYAFTNAGWKLVQPHPLIWFKPGQGVAADHRRRPRHVYETALLFSRGDRKIIRVESDVFDGRKEESLHINQKSEAMLSQFLAMLVDEHTAVFDPTCGSGSALAVAKRLGAQRILGLEVDEENADVARHVVSRGEQVDA